MEGEGVCGDTAGEMLVRENRSLEILSAKKEAKLSAGEMSEVEEGEGDEDLRCINLFTVCQRRRGFSDEETRSSADADNGLDAFSGQSRSTIIVPVHMLHIVSYCAIVTCIYDAPFLRYST